MTASVPAAGAALEMIRIREYDISISRNSSLLALRLFFQLSCEFRLQPSLDRNILVSNARLSRGTSGTDKSVQEDLVRDEEEYVSKSRSRGTNTAPCKGDLGNATLIVASTERALFILAQTRKLVAVAKARKVRNDGIHFLGLRYVDATLAAYVGESVTLRYDPRDVAEIRVFHEQQFLCRAICPELAGATIPIREIVRARNKHRRDLQAKVRDRRRTVDELMEIKRGDARINKEAEEKSPRAKDKKVTLKRYFNE
jgi:Mu transposase, C-terminal